MHVNTMSWSGGPESHAFMSLKWLHGANAGSSYYSSDSDTTLPAGFKQYCVPIPLAPGKLVTLSDRFGVLTLSHTLGTSQT